MRVAFVASNPSHLGLDSPAKRNLYAWISRLQLKVGYSFFNVSNLVTPGNRPLKKSEYELDRLMQDLRGIDKIVALGTTASDALYKLKIRHFSLPHPSPRNRVLNNKEFIEKQLSMCKNFLEDAC